MSPIDKVKTAKEAEEVYKQFQRWVDEYYPEEGAMVVTPEVMSKDLFKAFARGYVMGRYNPCIQEEI